MGTFDRIVDGIKEVLKMSVEIKRLSEAVRDLSVEVSAIDRRLVRIETMAELSQLAVVAKRLPPEG